MPTASAVSTKEPKAEGLRLDRWLWCARFFKTRTEAVDAIKAGHVRVSGNRVKPARDVCVGDRITVAKGIYAFDVTVLRIPARRGPAVEAAQCYVESDVSRAAREQRAAEQRAVGAAFAAPTAKRPDKRTRRLIRDRGRGRP